MSATKKSPLLVRQAQRDAVILAALPNVPFDGWGSACLACAAVESGLDSGAEKRLFPDGTRSAVAHFIDLADRMMVSDLAAHDLTALKVRERVALAVRLRLERWQGDREAIRRALSLMPLPSMAGSAVRGWYGTVDAIWRAVGDRSTDFSFYTKRMLLAGVYGATLLYWLEDRSDGCADTWAFLDRRIGDVMRIPKLRAQLEARLKGVPTPFSVLRRFAPRV